MNDTWHLLLTWPLWFAVLAAAPLLLLYGGRTLVRHPRSQRRLSLAVRICSCC